MQRGFRVFSVVVPLGVISIVLGLFSGTGFAEPPTTINIRGQLLNAQGQALSGSRAFNVQFYNAASGGTALGSAISGTADVSLEGLFNIEAPFPAQALLAPEAWYEFAISSGATPAALVSSDTFPNRVKVVSVPFALEASKADHVDASSVGSGGVLNAEFDFLSGVTGGIQDQLDGKANAADLTAETTARQSADTALVAKAGDTMTGALTVNDSFVGIGQATAPGTVTDKLYNTGGTLQWNGNPAYRFPWTTVTADTQMAGNNGYIVDAASLLTMTLPVSASLSTGDTVRVSGMGTGGWKIAQNDGQSICLESLSEEKWTLCTLAGSAYWTKIASSSDGTKLAACANGTRIYTSTDSGATWTARESSRSWMCIASSADGMRLVAGAYPGYLYTSTDGGATWTACMTDTERHWWTTNISADGNTWSAGEYSNGSVYTSTDSGVTWTARATSVRWFDIASSSDGTRLAAAGGDKFFTSTDSGVTWTASANPPTSWMGCVTLSSDGTRLAVCGIGSNIYTSTDFGANWTARESARDWVALAGSADGSKLVALFAGSNGIRLSRDYGVTWNTYGDSKAWRCAAVSADGSKIALGVNGGYVYIYEPSKYITVGTGGSLTGVRHAAIELQYIGNDTFLPLSSVGSFDIQ